MISNLTAVAANVAFCITNLFGVKGDTTDNYLLTHNFFEEVKKVEIVNDSLQTKENVIMMTDNAEETAPVIEKDSHPLEPLLKAIIKVESNGNPKAYNKIGDCVGILQITKICVRECNRVLEKQGSKKRYTYADRWNKEKSIEMFYLLQNTYNPNNDIDKGIRIWNKRPSYKTKVLKYLNKK